VISPWRASRHITSDSGHSDSRLESIQSWKLQPLQKTHPPQPLEFTLLGLNVVQTTACISINRFYPAVPCFVIAESGRAQMPKSDESHTASLVKPAQDVAHIQLICTNTATNVWWIWYADRQRLNENVMREFWWLICIYLLYQYELIV